MADTVDLVFPSCPAAQDAVSKAGISIKGPIIKKKRKISTPQTSPNPNTLRPHGFDALSYRELVRSPSLTGLPNFREGKNNTAE